MKIPKKLRPILGAKQRHIILIGGRGSGKSMTAGDLCLKDCQTQGIKTACFREFQNTIEDSMHPLLAEEINRLGLLQGPRGFEVTDKKIKYKGKDAFKFRGMARNTEGIKSMFGFGRFLIEEAQSSSSKSIRTIKPTLREEASQIWWVANPKSRADPFSQEFLVPAWKQIRRDGYFADDDHMIVMCNWRDNGLMPEVLHAERRHDKEHLSSAEYEHIWEGEFYDEVANAIIPTEWFDAAVDAHIKLGFKPEGHRIVVYDPSDEGDDDKGLVMRHGSVIEHAEAIETGDVNDGCDYALEYFERERADHFVWDADGLGLGLKRDVDKSLGNRGRITYEAFHGGGPVDEPDAIYRYPEDEGRPDNEVSIQRKKRNRDVFKNKRAQYYWKLRDRFYRTYEAIHKGRYVDPDYMIAINSKIPAIDQLRSEICRVPRKPHGAGKIQIMSKEEMRSLPEPIPSPNMGDACMMSMTTPQIVETVKLRNSSPWGR